MSIPFLTESKPEPHPARDPRHNLSAYLLEVLLLQLPLLLQQRPGRALQPVPPQ